jgi:hypothetical protein
MPEAGSYSFMKNNFLSFLIAAFVLCKLMIRTIQKDKRRFQHAETAF